MTLIDSSLGLLFKHQSSPLGNQPGSPPKKTKRTFPTWRGMPCTDYALLQLVPAVCDLRPGLLDLPPLGFLNRPLHKEHWTLSPRKFKSLKKGLIPKHPVLLTTGFLLFLVYINLHFPLLLMKEILHQLMLVSHYLRGFIHPGCRRIPSINTSNWGGGSNFTTFRWLIHSQHLFPPWEW